MYWQAEDANPLQKALANKVGNYQLLEGEAGPGVLENVVDLGPLLRVRAVASCKADNTARGGDRTSVTISSAFVEVYKARQMLLGCCSPCTVLRGCLCATAALYVHPFFQIRNDLKLCLACSADIQGSDASALGCRIPLPFNNVAPGFIEWLYLDENLRITRGNKGSYFIHTRL